MQFQFWRRVNFFYAVTVLTQGGINSLSSYRFQLFGIIWLFLLLFLFSELFTSAVTVFNFIEFISLCSYSFFPRK